MSLVDDIMAEWDPPSLAPESYREFSHRIILPGGPMKGSKYDPASDPCQDWFISQLDDDQWERIYLCAPPQLGGKSLIAVLCPLMRDALQCSDPVGYALPTLADLNRAWGEKVRPLIEKGGFSGYLPNTGPGSRGGRPAMISMLDPKTLSALGSIIFFSGGAYGSTAKTISIDEIDQFRRADGEPLWQALEDIWARANSYGRRARRIGTGTIEHDEKSIIYELITKQSTNTRPWVPCSHCGRHQRMEWSRFTYEGDEEDDIRDSARYICEHCGVMWTESDRQKSLRGGMVFAHGGQHVDASGNIVGATPRTRSLGVMWTALECGLGSLGEYAIQHFRATQALEELGRHDGMRKFSRYLQCQPYTADHASEDGEVPNITREGMASRSRNFGWDFTKRQETTLCIRDIAKLPENVGTAIMSCDVQSNRIYWVATAIDGKQQYEIGWGVEFIGKDQDGKFRAFGKADFGAVLSRIDAEVCRLWPVEWHRRVIDTGYMPDVIGAWLKENRGWRGVYGQSSVPAHAHEMVQGLVGYDKAWMGIGRYVVANEPGIRRAWNSLLAHPDKAFTVRLPKGLVAGSTYISHMVSWHDTGAGKIKKSLERDDFLDCRKYTTAIHIATVDVRKTNKKYGQVKKL